jgi:steroid delta-isomerase-like uncharacterized protein
MAADQNRDAVRRLIDEAANGRAISVLEEVLTEDFRLPPGPDGLDRAGLAAVLEHYFAAFPDLHYEIHDLVAEGDKVVARLRMTGTHAGEYDGTPGSGKTFAVDEVDIFDVVDGRVSGYRIVWDELSFRRQLGLPLA